MQHGINCFHSTVIDMYRRNNRIFLIKTSAGREAVAMQWTDYVMLAQPVIECIRSPRFMTTRFMLNALEENSVEVTEWELGIF